MLDTTTATEASATNVLEASRLAVTADGAEAIVLGCGGLGALAARRQESWLYLWSTASPLLPRWWRVSLDAVSAPADVARFVTWTETVTRKWRTRLRQVGLLSSTVSPERALSPEQKSPDAGALGRRLDTRRNQLRRK